MHVQVVHSKHKNPNNSSKNQENKAYYPTNLNSKYARIELNRD